MTEKRKMPVRTMRISLDGDYDGWWFVARRNAPWGALEDLQNSDNLAVQREALAKIVTGDWNFVDEEGEPITRSIDQLSEDGMPVESPVVEMIRLLPLDLVAAMAAGYRREMESFPNV